MTATWLSKMELATYPGYHDPDGGPLEKGCGLL